MENNTGLFTAFDESKYNDDEPLTAGEIALIVLSSALLLAILICLIVKCVKYQKNLKH